MPNVPEFRIDFTISNFPLISGPEKVAPLFQQAGGGIQFYSNETIGVMLTNIIKLVK